ncbi:unnamed protein product [Rotaria sordida]|uniref:F-box domain-containing protein n=1 Tax=Rotaria sordida TaxID=392033 RepID=A0A815G4T1_9BILA|nr:unnamed protein product [Rotaria sordida]
MTQNKRQRYSLTDNCNDDIKKKKLQSTSLFSSITSNTYKSSINQFENLSNEVIYEIFEFLNVYQLYESFFDLNTRFRNLCIYSNLPIEINNQSLSKSTFQRYYTNLILPNKHRIRSLDLSDPFIIDFFSLSTEHISKYFQLQTLILDKMESGYLENLLTSLTSFPNLSSLIISIGLGSTTNTLWNLIFQLPVLKYCKISSEENTYLGFLPMSTHTNLTEIRRNRTISYNRVHNDYINTTLLYENDNHNHSGNAVSIEIRILEGKVCDRAINSNEATKAVIDNCLTNLSDYAVARLPDFKHIKRNIQNRHEQNDLPKISHDKTFNQILNKLATTKRNTTFLQYNSGPDNDRIVIFSSPEKLELLENCEQLSSINAFADKFTTTTNPSIMSGCFFYLQNSIQRKVQKFGLKTNYEQDPTFAHHINKIAALAFLHPNDVGQGFDDLFNSLPQILHPLLNYFENTHPTRQTGPHCVSTVLAMLTGKKPEDFQGKMNTQDPCSWSRVLQPYGMKLAYCPMDVRKLKFYMDKLIAFDDLFTLSYYTTLDPKEILADPDNAGWITGSHIVILHRNQIIDPVLGRTTPALEHECNDYHTKRIFRVVPCDYVRGF